MSYAAAKGRAIHRPANNTPAAKKPADLTEDQELQIDLNRRFVHEHMPEFVKCIKNLHAEGLIDGWRNVTRCTLLD